MKIGHRRRRGFTLIEMVVVITILVILAGMVVSKLDVFEMKANKAVAASSMGDIARYVQMYRINTTQYPDGWDTLLEGADPTTAALPVAGIPGTKFGLHPELTGGPPFNGTVVQLTTKQLNANMVGSLGRLFITTGYYFNPVTPTTTKSPGTQPAHTFAPNDMVAILNPADGKAQEIIDRIYPRHGVGAPGSGKPLNMDLVTFGLGADNTLISSGAGQNALMFEPPFYPNQNQFQYYNRYLCVFEVRNDDIKRPRLVAVLGADGDPMNDEIKDYYEN